MYYIQNIGLTKCFNLSSACSGRYTIPCTFYTIRIKERFYNTVKYSKIVSFSSGYYQVGSCYFCRVTASSGKS